MHLISWGLCDIIWNWVHTSITQVWDYGLSKVKEHLKYATLVSPAHTFASNLPTKYECWRSPTSIVQLFLMHLFYMKDGSSLWSEIPGRMWTLIMIFITSFFNIICYIISHSPHRSTNGVESAHNSHTKPLIVNVINHQVDIIHIFIIIINSLYPLLMEMKPNDWEMMKLLNPKLININHAP